MELRLLHQDCLVSEKVAKNGSSPKILHVVSKNLPFSIKFVQEPHLCSFAEAVIKCKLFYDWNDNEPQKEVDYVKHEPLEYRVHISDDGLEVTVECRAKVLTSQHEDSYFRVKVLVTFPNLNTDTYTLISHPIKVISKPGQAFRKRKQKPAHVGSEEGSPPITPPTPNTSIAPSTPPMTGKKRASEDSILETLSRIEALTQEQQKLMQSLVTETRETTTEAPAKRMRIQPSLESVEGSFKSFLNSFGKIEPSQRVDTIKELVSGLNPQESSLFVEFLNSYNMSQAALTTNNDVFVNNGLSEDLYKDLLTIS